MPFILKELRDMQGNSVAHPRVQAAAMVDTIWSDAYDIDEKRVHQIPNLTSVILHQAPSSEDRCNNLP